MKKKIIFGSISIVILLLSMPMIASINTQTKLTNENKDCEICPYDDDRCNNIDENINYLIDNGNSLPLFKLYFGLIYWCALDLFSGCYFTDFGWDPTD